jgi:hypothetical protein
VLTAVGDGRAFASEVNRHIDRVQQILEPHSRRLTADRGFR